MRKKTEKTTMPRRAYSYRRISTGGKQARGGGLDRQAQAERICTERGWFLDDVNDFTDEGKSGFHQANLAPTAALGRFLAMVKNRRISPGSVLIIESLDRLSRADVDEAYDLFRGIIRAGITIVTIEPAREYNLETSGNMLALLEPLFIFARANEESETKSYRAEKAWEAARKSSRSGGKPALGRVPGWMRKEGGGIVLIPEQVAVVRRIVALALDGFGAGTIARKLNDDGQATMTLTGRWDGAVVNQLLKSRSLVGEYQPRQGKAGGRVAIGEPIPGYYPSVLTEEEYVQVRAAIHSRRRKIGRPSVGGTNLFTGLLWDAVSRKRMALQTSHSAGKFIRYLAPGAVAGATRIRYDAIDLAVLDTLAMLRSADVLEPSKRHDEREHAIAALTARVTALVLRKTRLQADAADVDQDADAIMPVLAAVSSELKTTAAELDRLKLESATGHAEALAEAQTLRQLRDGTTGAEREELDRRIKAALPSVVSAIWVQCQRITERRQIVHVQISLRSGLRRDVAIVPDDLSGVRPWDLDALGVDFRNGAYSPVGAGDATAVP